MKQPDKDTVVAVIGLGYVGLPLAIAFGKKIKTIGFDLNQKKVAQIQQQHDSTGEVTRAFEREGSKLTYIGFKFVEMDSEGLRLLQESVNAIMRAELRARSGLDDKDDELATPRSNR